MQEITIRLFDEEITLMQEYIKYMNEACRRDGREMYWDFEIAAKVLCMVGLKGRLEIHKITQKNIPSY